jgi:5'-nucleotidase
MKITLKSIVPLLLIGVVALAGGCNMNKKSTTQQSASATTKIPPMNQAALDIPAAPPAAPAATFTPAAPPQPVVYDAPAQQPVIAESAADVSAPVKASPAPRARKASASVAPAASGTKYKIKKGESLWAIAQAKYGNGNKWKMIAAANPRLDPNKVMAGQTITLP